MNPLLAEILMMPIAEGTRLPAANVYPHQCWVLRPQRGHQHRFQNDSNFQIQIDFAGLHALRTCNPAKLDSAKVRRRRTFAESSFEFGIAVKMRTAALLDEVFDRMTCSAGEKVSET
jgi:hypothetical protein